MFINVLNTDWITVNAKAASLAVMIYGQRVMWPVDYVIQTESLN